MSGELFYAVPAECVAAGTSTADGHDIEAVHDWGTHIAVSLHVRDSVAPALHPAQRREPPTRIFMRGELVELCVFNDTDVDLSGHPRARHWRCWDGRHQRWQPLGMSPPAVGAGLLPAPEQGGAR